eukprot:jgi/Undpi1/8032/HiC_scaffold_24.g10504.m1
MNKLASAVDRGGGSEMSLDDILQEITDAKRQHRDFLRDVKKARGAQQKDLARRARLFVKEPFPHPRPWNDSPLLDPDRERMTPEAIAGDALLQFEEIKRARKEEAKKHPSWKYASVDRAFGEPPLYCCTNSYKRVLESHLVQAVDKITKSYEAMGEGTLRLSNLKADVGAELWLMKSSLDEVRQALEATNEEERLALLSRGKRRSKDKKP